MGAIPVALVLGWCLLCCGQRAVQPGAPDAAETVAYVDDKEDRRWTHQIPPETACSLRRDEAALNPQRITPHATRPTRTRTTYAYALPKTPEPPSATAKRFRPTSAIRTKTRLHFLMC